MNEQAEELRKKLKNCDQKKPYVFVSYSKQDAEKVYSIVLGLQEQGYNIWIDKEMTAYAGTSWDEPARQAVRNEMCKKVLFFMSESSMLSVPVCAELTFCFATEIQFDRDNEIPIVPVNLTNGWHTGALSKWVNALKTPENKRELQDTDYDILKAADIQSRLKEMGCAREVRDLCPTVWHIARYIEKYVLPNGEDDDPDAVIVAPPYIDAIMRNIPEETNCFLISDKTIQCASFNNQSFNTPLFTNKPTHIATLLEAAKKGNTEAVRNFLEKGSEINAVDAKGKTPLILAASEGHKDVVECLADAGADLEAKDRNGRTALFLAIWDNHEETAKALLKRGVSLDVQDKYGWTPLMWAAKKAHDECLDLLIKFHATFDENSRSLLSTESILPAIKQKLEAYFKQSTSGESYTVAQRQSGENESNNDAKEVNNVSHESRIDHHIQQNLEVSQNRYDSSTFSNNTREASRKESEGSFYSIFAKLTRHIGTSLRTTFGNPPQNSLQDNVEEVKRALIKAALQGNVEEVKRTLNCGTDINERDEFGRTALICAASHGHTEVVKTLLRYNPKTINAVDNQYRDALFCAVSHGHVDTLRVLLKYQHPNDSYSNLNYTMTPLMCAASNGDLEIMRILIENGEDCNKQNKDGWTPFMWAVWQGQTDAMRLLLKQHIALDIKDINGMTALMLATKKGNNQCVEDILKETSSTLPTAL